jgi:cytochrome P450
MPIPTPQRRISTPQRQAPGPRRRYPGEHLIAMRRDPLAFLTRLAAWGDVVGVELGPMRVHLVSRPDLVRDVLVTHHRAFHKGIGLQRAKRLLGEGLLTSEGELHRRQRRLVQPAFHHQRIAAYAAAMVDHAGRTSARWEALAAAGGGRVRVDAHAEMMRLTLAIVGRTLFDRDVGDRADAIGRALEASLSLFQRLGTMPFAELLERLPLPGNLRFRAARRELDDLVYGMIRERRASPGDRGDLLSMLLLAADDESGAPMSDVLLRDEVMTLVLAGHETTANALTWCWLLLARHPDAEARLQRELEGALGEREATAADLPALPYARAIVSESLRLFPPAWVIGRRAREDVELDGYLIPAGSIVLVSPWVMHRDVRWYAEPERFDPGRWLEGAEAARPRFAFFPFGGGPRICVGEQFAWTEATLVLATLARRWRLRLAPEAPVELRPSITLRPAAGLPMLLERRHAVP